VNCVAAFVEVMFGPMRRDRRPRSIFTRTGRAASLAVTALLLGACMSNPSRAPEVVSAGGMVYPESAHLKKVEGYVRVEYDITVDGAVANPRVVESVPPGIFDEAALAAVRSWRFHPAMRDGKVIESKGLVSRLDFKLGESEDYAR
jgi:TonB family protein